MDRFFKKLDWLLMDFKAFEKKHVIKKDGKNFILTDFEYVEVSDNKIDRYQFEIAGAIRCYSKKADLYTFMMQDIDVDEVVSPQTFDFDEAISQISSKFSGNEVQKCIYPEWQRGIFFLPSYWEEKIANIIQKKETVLDNRLIKYIPENIVDKLGLTFVNNNSINNQILNRFVGKYSTSFFKVFDEKDGEIFDNDILEQAFCSINKLLGGNFIDTHLSVGSLPIDCGLFLPNKKYRNLHPKTKHYDFWKLNTSFDFCKISSNFEERNIQTYV